MAFNAENYVLPLEDYFQLALAEWNKYDQQRPDYEEYVKALNYMQRVDNKIANEQELEVNPNAQIITDGNGNPVKLGSE